VLADADCAASRLTGEQGRQAKRQLALAYHAGAALLTKLGDVDLARVMAERGLLAARESDDTLIIGSLLRSTAHVLLAANSNAEALDLVTHLQGRLRPGESVSDGAYLSMYGTLLLTGSIAAARVKDRKTSASLLADASSAADRLGHDANHLWTAFGPTNIAVHRVSTAMEVGDVTTALDIGPRIDTSALPVERRIRHALEVARAFSYRNRFEAALGLVLKAEHDAPEHVRTHFLSRQLVTDWIRRQRCKPSADLRALATRLNVTA
jgi:hypothetical protein